MKVSLCLGYASANALVYCVHLHRRFNRVVCCRRFEVICKAPRKVWIFKQLEIFKFKS